MPLIYSKCSRTTIKCMLSSWRTKCESKTNYFTYDTSLTTHTGMFMLKVQFAILNMHSFFIPKWVATLSSKIKRLFGKGSFISNPFLITLFALTLRRCIYSFGLIIVTTNAKLKASLRSSVLCGWKCTCIPLMHLYISHWKTYKTTTNGFLASSGRASVCVCVSM